MVSSTVTAATTVHGHRRRDSSADPSASSSPGFGNPVHRVRMGGTHKCVATKSSILPILLPPSTLRPVAFRTFTRKHNLTISSSALQTLAVFVGKNCGTGWREEGLAERVLDEVAKTWKKSGGGVIVEEGKGASLKGILHSLESSMVGGRVATNSGQGGGPSGGNESDTSGLTRSDSNLYSTGSSSDTNWGVVDDDDSDLSLNPRRWTKVIGAFEIPRLTYNVGKRYFEAARLRPSLFPPASHKTALFRDRYNLVHQRLLRNDSFQSSYMASSSGPPSLQRSASMFNAQQNYTITQIANLLGRNRSAHLLLGLLSTSPTGNLSLVDLTGSVALDLSHARMVPEDGAWFSPGMVLLVEGIYEEGEDTKGALLGGFNGVGGAIGGIFIGASICGPPCERRDVSLGTNSSWQSSGDISSSGGFGWVDFLGVGSERAQGPRMRKIETKCLRREETRGSVTSLTRLKVAVMSEVNLDSTRTFDALKKVFGTYNSLPSEERPIVYILIGNFSQNTVIDGGGRAGSVEYKEYFDSLALVLSDFPSILRCSTFVFIPGDKDPWASSFSAGTSSAIPRGAIPELFTSRVKRAFTNAGSEAGRANSSEPAGEAVWSSNPSRLTLFGPLYDIAVFRDDISGRLRRNAVTPEQGPEDDDVEMADDSTKIPPMADTSRQNGQSAGVRVARKLVKTVLDQGTMSPFPLSLRPVLWDYASALQLYPLPTALILADAEAPPFCITYEGCHVMNPRRLVPDGESASAQWIEYDVSRNRGRIKEEHY